MIEQGEGWAVRVVSDSTASCNDSTIRRRVRMGTALSQQRTTRAFGEVTRGRAVYVRADASGIEIERRPAASGVRSVDTFVSTGSRGQQRQRNTTRPAAGAVHYGSAPRHGNAGTQVSRAAGPSHGRKRATSGLSAVVATFVITAGVVAGLDAIANLRMAQPDSVPTSTDSVQVRRGESHGDVAARVAPEAPVAQVVDRIVELNAMSGAEVRPGQILISPVSHGG
ncbi:LysM peptidoglycan-binding domain-containing protein [Rhodococcus hoagii]|uniref:LysM peptidoglycan-binding domain-containing protein n=1 Tax=Rhodococcus hoagii TaxID=43767 RepID=A0AAE2WDG9_RHOHA|nr:LysM peptidoglycan-binding domain-containing protein [Prescottella equi]MBM4540369.1 LysM peptidoglycan-binding domain-containing protein [Prescottella equi]MBM4717278.1 LysM peptidoglycan-binding domain-containing protein [Prescottella equi]NKS13149.1 LysM peptidoglycan-binding domain-containing protein [Prescottella equi]